MAVKYVFVTGGVVSGLGKGITDSLIAAVKGDIENGLIFCGANAWKAEKIETVEEVVASLFT